VASAIERRRLNVDAAEHWIREALERAPVEEAGAPPPRQRPCSLRSHPGESTLTSVMICDSG